MPIDFEKPQPFMVDGRPHFTLSSYAPVSISLSVPAVIDEMVDSMIDTILENYQATHENLEDKDWVRENLQCEDKDDFRKQVHEELVKLNERVCDEDRQRLALQAFTERLQQSIPAELLERARLFVQNNLEHQLDFEGRTLNDLIRDHPLGKIGIDQMLDEQARAAAEEQAVLSAYAREKRLSVEENEIADLLQVPEDMMEEYIRLAKEDGTYDSLLDASVAAKAAMLIGQEAQCTYHYETENEARARYEQTMRIQESLDKSAPNDEAGDKSGFELV